MLEFSDIQGNIVKGYSFPFARFLFLTFETGETARAWLSAVVDEFTSAEDWGRNRPRSTFNIALTHLGLAKLGVNAAVLASFSEAFREGMVARATRLGDTGVNAPTQWENDLGSPEAVESIHAMISLYGETLDDIDAKLSSVLPERTAGVSVFFSQEAGLLPGSREHFGFRDGISQPRLEAVAPPKNAGGGLPLSDGSESAIAIGEFVLGYPGQGGITHTQPAAPFDKNSTYIVYRKLRQHVAAFRNYVNTTAQQLQLDPEWLKSRMVGRWKDGTPIILSPDTPDGTISGDPDRVNNFRFAQDPTGLGCPIGAHIRRTNPRDGLAGGVGAVEGHRLLRRGITYGDQLPEGIPENGVDRGLLFVVCNANLREQFEFVQRLWLNDSGFTGTLDPAQKDPIAGNNVGAGTMTLPMPGFPRQLQGIPDFVTLRYGVYLFAPGLQALRALSH